MNALDARRRILGKGVYKKTVEGNPAIAQGSLSRRNPGITMQGWTEQAQYEGNQLFDKSGIVLTSQVQYIPVNVGDGEFTLSTQYNNTYRKDVFFLPGNVSTGASSSDNGVALNNPITVTSENGYVTVALRLNSEGDMNPLDYNIMLNEGSTALPWEPYTGGAPSPSPDYPQPITNAGKYNEETGKYQYQVKLTGANLFDPDGEIVDGSPYDGIPLNNNGIVSMALYEKNQDVDVSNIYFGICSDKLNSNEVGWAISNGGIQAGGKIISPSDNRYVCWYPGNDTVLQNVLSRYDVMVNYGDGVYLPYQPYTEQTVTITSDRPLTKWDKLEKRNGQWGWVYKSGSYTVTGEEYFLSSADTYRGEITSDAWCLVDSMFAKVWTPSDAPGGYCEKLYWSQGLWEKDGLVAFTYNMTQIHIRLKNSDTGVTAEDTLTDVANKIKAYVAQKYEDGNPFIFWYETTGEIFVPLSETEQEQMNALYTFRHTTVLSNDCECEMTLTYKTKKSLEVTT